MSILIVEDTPSSALLLRKVVERTGEPVLEASAAEEALTILERRPDVRLLLTDVRMPGMDGIELVRTLRRTPELESLPVLFVTGVSDATTVKEAVGLGSRGWILKTLDDPARMLTRLESVLEDVPPALEHPDRARKRVGLGRDEYRTLLRAFADQVREALETLEAGGELEPAVVHGLEEGARHVGAPALVVALRDGAGTGRAHLLRTLRALRWAVDGGPPADETPPEEGGGAAGAAAAEPTDESDEADEAATQDGPAIPAG